MSLPSLREIRLIARGGPGIVTAGELLGKAAVDEGRHAQSLPTFGPERRGALCSTMLRVSGEPILLKCTTAHPDVLLLIDPTIWHHANVLLGVGEGATLIFNSNRSPEEVDTALRSGKHGYRLDLERYRLLVVDGTGIARRCLGRPIPNTAMMGALAEATGLVSQESMEVALRERFGARADGNINAALAARAGLIELTTPTEA